jgi:LuxR family maltose regulon positive regulatory protein
MPRGAPNRAPGAVSATMGAPILVTKLYAPPPRPEAIPRPRLTARLDAGLRRRLTLVVAPAGFGKTALVSAWVAGCGRRVAWLSLDAGDSDPARFLAYLVAALRTIAPEIGVGVLSALQSPQPPPAEATLSLLLNELATLPEDVVLVLDDYHAVDAAPVDQALSFVLEHLPHTMHLVVATREDPPLPLARLRARGQVTELRAADLQFTPDEAAAFLTGAMGLDLAAADVAALESRTEGWVAGLQLAALSLQGRADAPGFIRAFAGDDRYIVDYLVDEVLRRQPADVRSFLLQTSILARLSGPAVRRRHRPGGRRRAAGGPGARQRLPRPAGRPAPLVPLPPPLRRRALAHCWTEQPDQLATLHRRASAWYERQGEPPEAIRHALAAGDVARAADLVERALPAMLRSRQEATLLGWLGALPDEVVRRRPVLGAGYASALLLSGELAGVEDRLRDAERWLDVDGGQA